MWAGMRFQCLCLLCVFTNGCMSMCLLVMKCYFIHITSQMDSFVFFEQCWLDIFWLCFLMNTTQFLYAYLLKLWSSKVWHHVVKIRVNIFEDPADSVCRILLWCSSWSPDRRCHTTWHHMSCLFAETDPFLSQNTLIITPEQVILSLSLSLSLSLFYIYIYIRDLLLFRLTAW
jgi:hypothetical protein